MGKKQERKISVSLQQFRRSTNGNTGSPIQRLTSFQLQNKSRSIVEQHQLNPRDLLQSAAPEDTAVVLSSPLNGDSKLQFHNIDPQRLQSFTTNGGTDSSKERDTNEDISDAPTRGQTKRWGYKNAYAVSVAFFVIFTAFIGLQNLQSSINSSGGLGLASLTVAYVFFLISGFLSPSIIKLFGTKYSLLLGFLCHLLYTLANYYPSWYTLIPSSVIIGFASGPIWAAASTHLVEIAISIAPVLKTDQGYLISKFTGILYCFFQCAQIPGNLASSLILFPYGGGEFDMLNGTEHNNLSNVSEQSCNVDGSTFNRIYLYILVSLYVLFIVAGLIVLLVFVDHLPTNNSFFSSKKKFEVYLKEPLFETVSVLKNVRMMLLAPMAVFNGLELSFAFGTFTNVYISSCFGTYQVGFTLISLGVTSSILSLVCGRIIKYIPRFTIVLLGGAINVALLSFLLVWSPVPSYAFIFTFAVGWGVADAVWNTMTASLTGIIFANCSDSAYSAVRIYLALGFTMGFAMAELLSLHVRLWVLLVAVLIAVLCNLIVEFLTQSKHSLCPCIFRKQKELETNNQSETNETSAEHEKERSDENTAMEDNTHEGPERTHANPMFMSYDGRRPSTWSTNTTAEDVPECGPASPLTNPMFMTYDGRRPSNWSACSIDLESLDGIIPTSLSCDLETYRNEPKRVCRLSPLPELDETIEGKETAV